MSSVNKEMNGQNVPKRSVINASPRSMQSVLTSVELSSPSYLTRTRLLEPPPVIRLRLNELAIRIHVARPRKVRPLP